VAQRARDTFAKVISFQTSEGQGGAGDGAMARAEIHRRRFPARMRVIPAALTVRYRGDARRSRCSCSHMDVVVAAEDWQRDRSLDRENGCFFGRGTANVRATSRS
jgi:acetylornithine deacetylase/succinyl-diaminopimelate desuccinylase-like protein